MSNMQWGSIEGLRKIGNVEGVSFLLLLGVAMPLKYVWGWPWAVKVVGWAHGVLFVAFGCSLLGVWREHRWSIFRVGLVFVAALLPFGPFIVDRKLLRNEGRAEDERG